MDAGCLIDEKRTRTENICVSCVLISEFGALRMTKHYINLLNSCVSYTFLKISSETYGFLVIKDQLGTLFSGNLIWLIV
jgi:hypothetical protein